MRQYAATRYKAIIRRRLVNTCYGFFGAMNRPKSRWLLHSIPPFSIGLFALYFCSGISSILIDAAFLSFLAIILIVAFHTLQDYLLYYPEQPEDSRFNIRSPSELGMNHESLTIRTSDNTLIHGFLIKSKTDYSQCPTVIMYHGNAGNIGHRLENALHLSESCGFNVLMMEYRGYGLSGGEISESGLYDDGLSTVKYVKNRKDLDSRQIILHGRSLGGAVAIYVASQLENSDILAVILENTFTSLPNIAKHVLNISLIRAIPHWCYKNQYPSIERIPHVKQPTLFISGRVDTLVPPKHMDDLAMASGAIRKDVSLFSRGGHNDTWVQSGYFTAISKFVQQLV